MTKNIKYFFVGIGIGILLGVIGFLVFLGGVHVLRKMDKQSAPPPEMGGPGHPSLIYPANPADNNILLGASHNVFIGKVLAQTGNKETEIGPRTQYQVQVVSNIKGELGDTVTVDMLGGYDTNGKPVFIEDGSAAGENPLFQPGSTYLFATRYNVQEDWYTVIAHSNARKILSTDSSLPIQALHALAENDVKVKQFEAAYVSEILDKADMANNNTRNSFQSLPPEAKAAAQARADAARAALNASI